MTEMETRQKEEKSSTGDGNVSQSLLPDGSKETKEHSNSHNERRLIEHLKDRSGCISVFLLILLIISLVVNIYLVYFIGQDKQSCISVKSCQNITSLQKLIILDDYNCSSTPTGNGTTNVERILKLELLKTELKVLVQLPTNFILHKFSYDDDQEIVVCRKGKNHYYISCNKPYNDNCTVIHKSTETNTITTIQETGDQMVTYEIPTNCIYKRADLEWIQPQKCRSSSKPKI
ncbi:uncharacterized protein LOC134705316 [Mytilus trossulus]|uniref:uncharacterized protein LOC134705316 n=1 Tax=Mytilus trossulus TaxID=6551 RepID=UPI0030068AB8